MGTGTRSGGIGEDRLAFVLFFSLSLSRFPNHLLPSNVFFVSFFFFVTAFITTFMTCWYTNFQVQMPG